VGALPTAAHTAGGSSGPVDERWVRISRPGAIATTPKFPSVKRLR